MVVRFSRHAVDKLAILARHGFSVTEAEVIAAVLAPDQVDETSHPMIAQRRHGENHVLRVVFRREGDEIVVITVYPGRRRRYEG